MTSVNLKIKGLGYEYYYYISRKGLLFTRLRLKLPKMLFMLVIAKKCIFISIVTLYLTPKKQGAPNSSLVRL